jgi:O-antigen/teichoic acid export membrane protein
MSNPMTQPSEQSPQRRPHRLNIRPLAEQATAKLPASFPDMARFRTDLLVASPSTIETRQLEAQLAEGEITQLETQGRLSVPCIEEMRTQHLPVPPQSSFSQEQTQKLAVPISLPDFREGMSKNGHTSLRFYIPSRPLNAAPFTDSSSQEQDVSRLDTSHISTRPLTERNTPEFDKLSTLPMMVLQGVSQRQDKAKLEMKSEVSGAASNAGIVGLGSIIGSLLKYVSAFLIQYGFGAGGYGLYTLSLSFVNLVSAIFNLGLDDATVRYVAIYRGKHQIRSLRGVLLFCTTLAGIAGIIGAVLLVIFTPPLVTLWIGLKHHAVQNAQTLERATSLMQVMAPVIPLMTMQVMWYAGLRGFKAFKWRVLATNILQPILQILLLAVVLAFFRNKDGITYVAAVLVISTMFNAVLNLYFLFRQVDNVATPEPGKYEVREWLTFAMLNFLTTIMDTVLDSIDTILLAAFGVSDVQLGQYGAAMRLSNFIQMPLMSINNIFAPTIAELHSKGEMQKLETMFKIMGKWSITFSLPLFLVSCLFAPYLVVLPGASFAPAWPLLIAFAVGAMINAGTGAVGYMLLMTGYQKLSFLNSMVAVAVNIGLGIYLTPRYGAMGTAVSTGLAIVALNIMRLLQVRLLLKMHPYYAEDWKPLAAGLVASAVVGGILYLLYHYHSHIHTSAHLGHAILSVQLLLIPVFLGVYIFVMSRFKASPDDEIVLKAIRKKFLGGKGKNKGKKSKKKVKEA